MGSYFLFWLTLERSACIDIKPAAYPIYSRQPPAYPAQKPDLLK